MNLHAPQNTLAETELRHLAAIPYQIISPSGNAPIIGIYQDSLLGSYRFTRPNISFTPREAMNLLMMYPKVDVAALREAGNKITNFDILSQILSPITLKYKTSLFDDDKDQMKDSNNVLEIRNGKYIRGQMEKSTLASTTKGIIHRICNDFGNMQASLFIDDLQNVVTEYMKTSSFSVGISDLIADRKTQDEIIKIIVKQKQEVQSLIEKVHLGTFENNSALTNMAQFEQNVNNALNEATNQAGSKGRKSLAKTNRFVMIVNSGSKGTPINISQMISCLGQQNVDGKRIPYGFDSRTLPHFSKFDDSPQARGFIENSYISGLTAPELFFHAMGGRIGLIDTACKSVTWETPVIILENDVPKYIEIGRWIDTLLESTPEKVKHFTERQMELLDIDNNVYIPTTDENGVVTWGEITAITRHDPGDALYEIKTHGGRSVIVTESKSLLIWNPKTKTLDETSTPDIKIGDSVPVTGELCKPPTVLNHISLVDYLPKTELNIFESFDLNEENGIFLGIYLSKGTIIEDNIIITTESDNIRLFVSSWFEKHNISFVKNITTVTVNSLVLSKFLLKLVGDEAENKFVPSEAFVSPDSFIIGLLNGYYSGNGSFTENLIVVSSISKRLIEGISMLCSRLGMFGKITKNEIEYDSINEKNAEHSYSLSITAQWAKIFKEKISLIDEIKNENLKSMEWNNKKHMNFDTYNNIVLDKITEINILGVEKYPKVYDLTIPSTLNFGLANGLQVRDTSQTGYIQRRLIKGLEDLKVEYDMTVRNNKGRIVQFSYGDDHFDSTKVENQSIPLTGMTTEDIYLYYDIVGTNDQHNDLLDVYSKGTITRIKRQRPDTQTKCKKYIEKMIKARTQIVESVFKNKSENAVKMPVAFQNIIANIQGQLNLNSNSVVDITPLEAFELIEEYFNKLKELKYCQPTELFEIVYYFYLTPKDLLVNKRFHRKALVMLLETIILKYKQAIVHPGEMVGVIAGQSTGEPTTQLTLNSVTYETEILVRNSKKEIKAVQIGDFTKWGIETSKKIDYMKDKDTTYAELSEFYEVPSATENGETVWRRIEAVTKHPVINTDGTNTMLKITTEGCREVIATKAKSFLQLIDGKIQGINGAELKVGGYLPVSKKALEYTEQFEMNLREILPPTEYLYGSELQKAKEVMHEHHWWNKHANKTFILPHSRSDSVVELFKENVRVGRKSNKSQYIRPNNVYMKLINSCEYDIPENIILDYDFGYLVGAYCAEGCMTKHQISIANNDDEYLIPVQRWCEKHNITTKIYCNKDKIQEGWTSQDIRIYNTVLCRILSKLCGNLSHNKFVSDKIIFSNRECILGFLDAYIGGDGSVGQCKRKDNSLRTESISASSVSYKLLLSVQIMLKNLGIVSKINKTKKQEKNNRGTKPENFKQPYLLTVRNKQSQKLAELLNMKPSAKNDKAKLLLNRDFKYEYYEKYLTVPNIVNGEVVMELRDNRFVDTEFDKIISIEEVSNTTNYAYDLTVEDTRTFDCINGVNFYDTFHLAGVASKSNVTRGVPRIEEILRLTKNPKNPSLTVFLKPIDETERDRATQYANMLEHTKLIDVTKSVQICFDPNDRATTIIEDRLLLEQYYEFEDIVIDCMEQDQDATGQKSKWIIRLEFDAETLLEKNITMDDIHFAITNGHGNDISCVYSDYNSDNLIFRIRLNSSVFNKTKKQKGIPDTLDQSDEIYMLRNFQETLLNNIVLRGIQGIRNVLPRKLQNYVVKDEGKYSQKDIWILDTTGTNLLDVLAFDFIDPSRTYSNDIKEIFDVLGIEAARQTIYNELYEVMEFAGVYINYHHLSLLVDRMTSTQNMVSIFRSGILNDDIGPISKSTFEVHTEVLLNASRHADFDHMRGVSANVMMGQMGVFGTGSFKLILDMDKMKKMNDTDVDMRNIDNEIEKEFGLIDDKTDTCSKPNIEIQNNITNLKYNETNQTDNDEYDMGF
jgi:DNA-directed RNA polymerase beta' subunit